MKNHGAFNDSIIPNSGKVIFNGKFGRMFPHLPAWTWENDITKDSNFLINISTHNDFLFMQKESENDDIPAGYTYLGQFISHDISFDPTSVSEREQDPDYLWSFRTPALDLDSIYGGGIMSSPFLFDRDQATFLLQKVKSTTPKGTSFWDFQRNINGVALIVDHRNDENVLISQLTVAFKILHNKMVRSFKASRSVSPYDSARKLTIWHYQYIILNDYLPRITGRPLVFTRFNQSIFKDEPFIPVEFSAAGFRFGHSQIRSTYKFNEFMDASTPLFPDERPEKLFYVDWRSFFGTGSLDSTITNNKLKSDVNTKGKMVTTEKAASIIKSARINPIFSSALKGNFSGKKDESKLNLLSLDLLRGLKLRLPSGQSIARSLGFAELNWSPIKKSLFTPGRLPNDFNVDKFINNTPLWYYILAEAFLNEGKHLGPVGAYIVEQTIVGLILADKNSYLNQHPNWVPVDNEGNEKRHFTMADLLNLAGILDGAIVRKTS